MMSRITSSFGSTKSVTTPAAIQSLKFLCIDESGSMGENASNSEEAKGYTRRDFACQGAMLCVAAMPVGTHVCVLAFDDKARVVCEPIVITEDNRKTICSKIMEIMPQGGTNIKTCLFLAKQVMELYRCESAHIILITDGEDDGLKNGVDLANKLKDLRTHGEFAFKIDTIGLGPNADTNLLVKLAGLCRGVYALCISAFEVGTVFGRAATRAHLHHSEIFCMTEVNEPATAVNKETKEMYLYFKAKLTDILVDDDYTKEYIDVQQKTQIQEYTAQISLWLQQCKATHQGSEYFQRIQDMKTDVKEQIYLAISSDTYWKAWGYSYWKTTGIALQKCYSPNSKDVCLSHFGTVRAKELYEEVSQLYEKMPLIEKTGYSGHGMYGGGYGGLGGGIPQAQAVALTTAHFNDRDAGCFHPDSELEMEMEMFDNEYCTVGYEYIVGQMKEKKEVWIRGQDEIGGQEIAVQVEAVIRVPRSHTYTEFCTVDGTTLTPTHPIEKDGQWVHPKDSTYIFPTKVDYVFNFVLAIHPETGKRHQAVYVDGNLCVCLGHGIQDGSVAEDAFWGTERVIDEYKRLYPEEYARGYIENATHTMVRDWTTGYVIGFK